MFQKYRSYSLSNGVKTKALAVFNDGSEISVMLHRTVVVQKSAAGTVTLRDGGWDTISTRTVINTALRELAPGWSVVRRKGATYLESPDGQLVPFISGMSIWASFKNVYTTGEIKPFIPAQVMS